MSGKVLLARVCLVAVFFVSSIQKYMDSSMYERMLIGGYRNLHSKFGMSTGVYFPLTPIFVENYSKYIIILAATLQIIGGVLALYKNKYGPILLSLVILAYNLVIHNPVLFYVQAEKEMNTVQLLLNFGWIAGLLILSSHDQEELEKEKTD